MSIREDFEKGKIICGICCEKIATQCNPNKPSQYICQNCGDVIRNDKHKTRPDYDINGILPMKDDKSGLYVERFYYKGEKMTDLKKLLIEFDILRQKNRGLSFNEQIDLLEKQLTEKYSVTTKKEEKPKRIIYQNTYGGFEDAYDLSRDVSECLNPAYNPLVKDLSDEFTGTITLTMTYEEEENNELGSPVNSGLSL